MDLSALGVVLVLLVGLAVGVALGWLAASSSRTRVQAQRDLLAAQLEQREREALGDRELTSTVAPLRDTLDRVEAQLHELERERVGAYASLREQVSHARQTSEQLRAETAALVTALRAPQARGQWGEMQLRRVVELAGMIERCDFDEQPTVTHTDGRAQRPDLVVRLAGGKSVVVDAKVSLAAYLTAAQTTDDDVRADRLAAHARHLRAHVDGLAAKEYWASFRPTPEFVVLFVPGEAFLAPALSEDPTLLEDAMRKKVMIATPTTLVAMLRTIAYAWQQEALTANARAVFEVGEELYARLATMGGHVDQLGRSLRQSVEAYNRTVGSLEKRVLVTARRLADLEVTDRELPKPTTLEVVPQPLTATELVG